MAGETSGGEKISSSSSKSKLVTTGLLAVALLLGLTGFTAASSAVVFVVALPFLVLFSPVLLPAAIAVGAAMLAFGVCGMVGLGGLCALRWALGRRFKARVDDVEPDGGGSESDRVRQAVTEAGHQVSVQERDVGGYRQREVQVKGA